MDWQETYEALLNDLGARRLRLAAYWDIIEPLEGQFAWGQLDYQMDRAQQEGARVILAVGRKLPRWPECREPGWTAGRPEAEKQRLILRMLTAAVERYKGHPALVMWQLENEPLLDFGDCPPEDKDFLAREEALLRAAGGGRPILITDSGELNSWLPAAGFGDVLGTTMYRTVFSGRAQDLFHYDYLFPAWLYRAKARLVKLAKGKKVIISELQGEPWGEKPYEQMSKPRREEIFPPDRLRLLLNFARRTQLPEAYWWGAEYWYWEKQRGDPRYWNIARGFFQ